MLPKLDELAPMARPYEILELSDGQAVELRPVRYELGRMTIEPRDGRPPKLIAVLRLHVRPEDKRTLPHYLDVTAAHLVAGLLPYLEKLPPERWRFTATKHGREPRARFTLQVDGAEV